MNIVAAASATTRVSGAAWVFATIRAPSPVLDVRTVTSADTQRQPRAAPHRRPRDDRHPRVGPEGVGQRAKISGSSAAISALIAAAAIRAHPPCRVRSGRMAPRSSRLCRPVSALDRPPPAIVAVRSSGESRWRAHSPLSGRSPGLVLSCTYGQRERSKPPLLMIRHIRRQKPQGRQVDAASFPVVDRAAGSVGNDPRPGLTDTCT